MPVKVIDKKAKRNKYVKVLTSLLDEYPRILLVTCTNVGSSQMQKIRQSIRHEGILLMGKNTLIRKVVRDHLQKHPELEPLLGHIKGEIGFVFTNADLVQLRNKLQSIKVEAPAKAGAIAPNEVIIPAGNTGLEPTQTSFLQALNIASKINKGQVEIISDVSLLKKGDKVGPSEAALLSKLNIRPFSYGVTVKAVYEGGFVFDQRMIDMMNDAEFLLAKIRKGVQAMASVSLALSYPTVAAVPHVLSRGFQHMVSLTLATTYNFAQAERLKSAAATGPAVAATPVATASAPAAGGKAKDDAAAKKKQEEEEKKKKEEEEKAGEEEVDLGGAFDIFG